MEFFVKRTSTYLHEKQPCKEAMSKLATCTDYYNAKTLEEARKSQWGEEFFGNGTNHREENGIVVRDTPPRPVWVISIDSLDDLVALVAKYGEVLIHASDCREFPWELEVYDDYRA